MMMIAIVWVSVIINAHTQGSYMNAVCVVSLFTFMLLKKEKFIRRNRHSPATWRERELSGHQNNTHDSANHHHHRHTCWEKKEEEERNHTHIYDGISYQEKGGNNKLRGQRTVKKLSVISLILPLFLSSTLHVAWLSHVNDLSLFCNVVIIVLGTVLSSRHPLTHPPPDGQRNGIKTRRD